MRIVVFLGILFLTSFVQGQREAANWYFGTHAGLDFNSGVPQVLTNGQLRTVEGCESFSDPDGNLLFYTEGNNVWNRFHELMPNGTGLKGSFSTSQSALAVPNPLNNGIYYVFTPDDVLAYRLDTPNGFNYSVIDMSGDNGRGTVIQKNIDLLELGSEKVSAVLGATGDFFWVVTHYEDSFYSYRVDETGVNSTPVVSRVGPSITEFENFRGAIKVSPNGNNIAMAYTVLKPEYASSLHLFDFNTSNGQVSNTVDLSDEYLYYGLEFSSNSSKLYGSGRPILETEDGFVPGQVIIQQFDLNSSDVRLSRYELARFPLSINTEVAGSLQIGIDKKIYHSIPNDRLSVIRTPNKPGFDADFRMFNVDLGDKSATYGLPPFIQSFFETIIEVQNVCYGDLTLFETDSNAQVQSINWDFGDPASGNSNYATGLSPSHIFSNPGVYTVNLEVQFTNNSVRNFVEFVEIAEIPDVNLSVTLTQCDVDGLDDGLTIFNLMEAIPRFNNGNPDITAVFYNTLADATANTNRLDAENYENTSNGQRIYARAFENSDCFTLVEIELEVRPMSHLGELNVLPLCIEESLGLATWIELEPIHEFLLESFGEFMDTQLFATKEDALLELNTLLEERKVFGPFDERAVYFRVEENNQCAGIGKLPLDFIIKPELDEIISANLCDGQVVLMATEGFENYSWSTGQSGRMITANQTGEFEVSFYSGPCEYTQTFIVEENESIVLEEVDTIDFSNNNQILIRVADTEQEILYSIDDGINYQSENLFTNLLPGLYGIRIRNDCMELTDLVIIGGFNGFFTPNSDGVNDYWTLENTMYFPKFRMFIYDRYGTLLNSFDEQGPGWDGTFRSRDMPSDDYWFSLEFETGRIVKGHFSLKR